MGRVSLELRLVKSIGTDVDGNWIVWAEASNENLDFQEQHVLQEALVKSKDYFLANGVISYDHRHQRPDPDEPGWNPEKYLIGEPLEVKTKGKKTFVKAKLYKSNPLAQEIVAKLKDKSTRVKASIAGKFPEIVKDYNPKTGRIVETVKSVLWDELAITYKPVNQTLSHITEMTPGEFVKSIQNGSFPKSLSQEKNEPKLGIPIVRAQEKITGEGTDFQSVLEGKELNEQVAKSFDDSITDLEKALGKEKPENAKTKPESADEGESQNADDGFDDDENADAGDGEDKKNGLAKSQTVEEEIRASGSGEFLDVSELLTTLVKSLSTKVEELKSELAKVSAAQKTLVKSQLAQSQFLKSLGNSPVPRQSELTRVPRQFGGNTTGENKPLDRVALLTKGIQAVREGRLDSREFTKMELRLNKGIRPDERVLELLK